MKFLSVVCFGGAAFFLGYAALQFANVSARLTEQPAVAPAVADVPPQKPTAAPPDTPRPAAKPSNEPVHKVLVRCLGDLDDLLDTVHDPASFEAVKPKILERMRQQAALAAAQPNLGMARMSRTAAQELQKAMNRHAESMFRASQVAPGVMDFFGQEVATVLKPN